MDSLGGLDQATEALGKAGYKCAWCGHLVGRKGESYLVVAVEKKMARLPDDFIRRGAEKALREAGCEIEWLAGSDRSAFAAYDRDIPFRIAGEKYG